MPLRHHILKRVHGTLPVLVPTWDTKPTLARYAVSGPIVVRMNIKQCWKVAGAVFQVVGINADHQCDPIPLARVLPRALHPTRTYPEARDQDTLTS